MSYLRAIVRGCISQSWNEQERYIADPYPVSVLMPDGLLHSEASAVAFLAHEFFDKPWSVSFPFIYGTTLVPKKHHPSERPS